MKEISSELKKFAIDELSKLVRIPSISFPGFDKKTLTQSAEATADLLRRSGFENVRLADIDGCFPYVLGEKITDPKKKTLLLYAHHDVQPPGREELWKTPPFEPTEKDGRLYGRGSADDKAGILVHAVAMKYFSSSECPVNLKVIIEGEEEVGSDHLLPFLNKNKEQLKADCIVVTDTGNIQSGVPSLTIGLRGLVTLEIEVKALKAPLHSGIWGGVVVDPVQVLVKMLSSLTNDLGEIQLASLGKTQRKPLQAIPITEDEIFEQTGLLKREGLMDHPFHRNWFEPSLAINAIQASSEKLANNIICDRAYSRIGIRLSGNQRAHDVMEELQAKLRKLAPSSVVVTLTPQGASDAWATDPQASHQRWAFSAAEKALEMAYGRPSVYIGCGASIPFIGPFEKALNAPVLTLAVEDPYTLAHSENESLLLSDFYKTIAAEIELFKLI